MRQVHVREHAVDRVSSIAGNESVGSRRGVDKNIDTRVAILEIRKQLLSERQSNQRREARTDPFLHPCS